MDRSNVYSICSYDLNMKLLRIWGMELTNMELSGLLILLPVSLPGGKRVVREPQHHSELLELLWWGSFWSVAGDSSARIVRESRRSWGFALIFPSCCLGKNNSCPWLFRSLALGSSPANSRQPHRIPVLMKG